MKIIGLDAFKTFINSYKKDKSAIVEDIEILKRKSNLTYPAQLYDEDSDTNAFKVGMDLDIVQNAYINENTGNETYNASPNIRYTRAYIPITSGRDYILYYGDVSGTRSYAHAGALYGEDKLYTRGVPKVFGGVSTESLYTFFTTSTKESYARVNIDYTRPSKWLLSEVIDRLTGANMTPDTRINDSGEVVEDLEYTTLNMVRAGRNPYFYYGANDKALCRIACFDKDKKFLGNTTSAFAGDLIYLISGTRYIIAQFRNSDESKWALKEVMAGSKFNWTLLEIEYNNLDNNLKSMIGDIKTDYWSGKKAVVLGDSITAGFAVTDKPNNLWHQVVAKELGLRECVNYGISGTKIAISDGEGANRAMSARYTLMDNDADLVMVLAGTNDYGHQSATGANTTAPFGDMADRTNTTFYGACHVLFKGLRDKYPDADILVLTPLNRHGAGGTNTQNTDSKNAITHRTLIDYITAITRVANYYSIPVFNSYTDWGANPVSNTAWATKYMPDRLHPNDVGSKAFGLKVARWIKGNL